MPYHQQGRQSRVDACVQCFANPPGPPSGPCDRDRLSQIDRSLENARRHDVRRMRQFSCGHLRESVPVRLCLLCREYQRFKQMCGNSNTTGLSCASQIQPLEVDFYQFPTSRVLPPAGPLACMKWPASIDLPFHGNLMSGNTGRALGLGVRLRVRICRRSGNGWVWSGNESVLSQLHS